MLALLLCLAAAGQVAGPPDPRDAFGPKPAIAAPAQIARPQAPPQANPIRDRWPAPAIQVFVDGAPVPRPQRVTAKITARPISPNDLYEAAAAALSDRRIIPANRCFEARFIAGWPLQPADQPAAEQALNFWIASMSNQRVFKPIQPVKNLGWVLYLSDYGWDHTAWEALVAKSPYFAVSAFDHHHQVIRGWLDPRVELAVREATGSQRAIETSLRFLGLTGIDVGDPRGGVYSKFLKLPNSEAQLFKQYGVDEKFLKDNYLLRGGAVLGGESIVARHNRELQLLPSPIGLDEGFIWRSLDMGSDIGDQSVTKNFLGSVRIDGGEYIGTNKSGLHWYYLINKQKNQVSEVPANIAQDRDDPHDAVVHTPYKCVKCHGPKGGIRHFDDVIARMALNPKVALSVIQKYKDRHDGRVDNTTKLAVEDYYLSPLAREISAQQESYTRIVREITGLSPAANTENYLRFVNEYLHGLVDRNQAAYELGVEVEQLDAYLKQVGNDELMAILASERIPRASFEQGFADGMKARIHSWERSPQYVPHAAPALPAQPAAVQPQADPKPKAPVRAQSQPVRRYGWRG